MKRKKLPLIGGVEIIDTGSEGQAVGKFNDLVIFVKGAVPGDVCDIQLTRKKNKYAEGFVVTYKSYSPKRVTSFCSHFGICGGCKWQNLDYKEQLFFKQKQVENSLARIAKIPYPEVLPIAASANTQYYRNKLEYTFSNKKWLPKTEFETALNSEKANLPLTDVNGVSGGLGFHIPGMFDKIVNIDKCYLQGNISNEIRDEVRAYTLNNNYSYFDLKAQLGLMRNLVIRTTSTGELMVLVIFFEDNVEKINSLLSHLKITFKQINSLLYIINPKRNDTYHDLEVHTFSGHNFIEEIMENLHFKISAKSFFQTNTYQAYELYKITRSMAALSGNELVYDLYTGTGTIANFIASQAKKVIGVEYVQAAIDDAIENSKNNNISNTLFFAGDMKNVLTNEFITENGKPDVVITDPPRAGMHEDVVNKILEMSPKRIVYVSCNPSTQARDLALLGNQYRITQVQPVDMFPHTHHVESVVALELI